MISKQRLLLIKFLIKLFTLLFSSTIVWAQITPWEDVPKKGSYLSYGQPDFEDNSFLLEEAFNQPMGVIQHISNFYIDKVRQGNFIYSFTQEIPLTDLTHQISYTLNYNIPSRDNASANSGGFGDLYISYRPSLSGTKQWAMVIPRFTLILPTGKSQDNLGNGGWGGQFNLAITKRLSRQIITNYNFGYTWIMQADKYQFMSSSEKVLLFEKNLNHQNIGASIIWYPRRKFNLLLEYTSNFQSEIEETGIVSKLHQLTLNPGFRFCIDTGYIQIVPGMSVPINFNGSTSQAGLFFYLSFEPDYLSHPKAKSN